MSTPINERARLRPPSDAALATSSTASGTICSAATPRSCSSRSITSSDSAVRPSSAGEHPLSSRGPPHTTDGGSTLRSSASRNGAQPSSERTTHDGSALHTQTSAAGAWLFPTAEQARTTGDAFRPALSASMTCACPRVTARQWDAVASWSWSVQVETCAICRNALAELCVDCQTKSATPQLSGASAYPTVHSHTDSTGSGSTGQRPTVHGASTPAPPFPSAAQCMVAWGCCSHVFHQHCITRWLAERRVCPLCARRWELYKLTAND